MTGEINSYFMETGFVARVPGHGVTHFIWYSPVEFPPAADTYSNKFKVALSGGMLNFHYLRIPKKSTFDLTTWLASVDSGRRSAPLENAFPYSSNALFWV
jgi:hypothetical protein